MDFFLVLILTRKYVSALVNKILVIVVVCK
jgi:hypothetical protein